jgi:hypothetical protein
MNYQNGNSSLEQKNGNTFLDQKNEAMLNRLVYVDFMRRTDGNINEKQKDRLMRTVHHYMGEVYNGNPRGNVQTMNKEVLKAVVTDFNTYLNRNAISASSDVDTRMKEDIGSRFSSLQNERTEQKALMPPVPDFRVPIEDSNDTPALTLFEKAKKNREAEARREESDSFSGTFLKDLIQESQGSGLATVNPTIAKPEAIRIRPPLAQDTIIPQDEILSYKENENNLVIYSADRDWYNNTRENRYNFSVTFNPANNSQGFKYSPSANMRFHNIVRIEMVKAIVPNESVNTLITNTGTGASPTYGTTTNLNVLTEPGIILHVDELESNVFGTDDQLDRAFATLQYDAQWVSDATTNNPGYLAMIPKFLKCQKTYYPTPLATLTKMTIQLQRPNGNLVNDALDTLDISGIFASTSFGGYTSVSVYMNSAVRDAATNATFYTIVTKTYFNRFAFTKNDRIDIQGINTSLITGNDAAKSDFKAYMESNNGLLIVATGYTNGTVFTDGTNNVGYCNFIVVQAPYRDPTTGSVLVQPFGGTTALNLALATGIANVNFTGARLINLSKQTQLTFRVITRDMDSATRIRPNNA